MRSLIAMMDIITSSVHLLFKKLELIKVMLVTSSTFGQKCQIVLEATPKAIIKMAVNKFLFFIYFTFSYFQSITSCGWTMNFSAENCPVLPLT